ncbi:KPN_02809 family neutral zinc metallopeptidase [Algivirga pacifica]|uniref:Neutral zinc metallopeptidase n=1 Tax=Algivirga pacifica TaxID=1162670 RepID=A0ABP9DQN1_9BACT
MRWKGRRKSQNTVDKRRSTGGGGKRNTLGLGGLLIAIVLSFVLGGNPLQYLGLVNTVTNVTTESHRGSQYTPSAEEDELAEFVSVVQADTEDVWNKLFRENNLTYKEPKLIMFTSATRSGCGNASAATGPFYCPADQTIYIDLSFYDELRNRFGAPGDFAMAYVIAHEVGHHVQHLLGTTDKVHGQSGRISKKEYNKLSVKLELQADFYAGVWARHADEMKDIMESGDLEEAINAANAIGDDRLQKQAQGYVVPDAFTHGTSEQRMKWFRKGYETGDVRQGNTFEAIQ